MQRIARNASVLVVVWQVVGAPLAAALLLMEGVGGLHGWQWLFIIEGAATCLWGIVLAVSSCHWFTAASGELLRHTRIVTDEHCPWVGVQSKGRCVFPLD